MFKCKFNVIKYTGKALFRAFPVFLFLTNNSSASNTYLEKLIQKAEEQKPWEDIKWIKLGHYQKNIWGNFVSEAAGKDFFASESGKTNPREELIATLKSFFATIEKNKEDYHPLCHFPARRQYLVNRLKIDEKYFPKVNCKLLNFFIKNISAKSVSIVFSSYYLNNPASTFGHSFLKFNKAENENELLDYGISFSANIGDANPILYSIGGLAGFFPGTYQHMPYYYKVREYNDHEARDLWTYRLALNEQEVHELLLHLWELSTTYFDYYFLTKNCSYQKLTAIEAVRPDIKLVDLLPFCVIPSDTIHAINKVNGFVTKIEYRPSVRRKFNHGLKKLNNNQAVGFENLVASANVGMIANDKLSEREQAELLDLYSDFLDYNYPEELAKNDSKESKLKYKTLLARSKLNVKTELEKIKPSKRDHPENGHQSARFNIGSGYSHYFGQTFFFEQRFALHDTLDAEAGYPKNGKIEFMNIAFENSEKNDLVLKYVDLIGVSAFTPLSKFEKRTSWEMRFGLQQDKFQLCKKCTNSFFEIGVGYSFSIDPGQNYVLYGLIYNSFEYSTKFLKDNLRYNLGPKFGLLFNLTEEWKLSANYYFANFPFSDEDSTSISEFESRYGFKRNQAIGVKVSTVKSEINSRLSYYVYY